MFETKLQKSLLGAATAGLMAIGLAGVANAGLINLGGVVFDPAAFSDFDAGIDGIETMVIAGGTLEGIGKLTAINGNGPGSFCPGGCEVTYEFGGFLAAGANGDGNPTSFTGGFLNIYVDNTPDFNTNTFLASGDLAAAKAAATDGTLFLTLAAVPGSLADPSTLIPTYSGPVAGTGRAFFDVTPLVGTLNTTRVDLIAGFSTGIANGNFDTDSIVNFGGSGVNAGKDNGQFDFFTATTFDPFVLSFNPLTLSPFLRTGGTAKGNAIPEPASLALLGFGLIGAGAMARRRRRRA